ncbi:mechanosensitive ion channel family protein [Salirhabdus salicampi]|uniref:mechanosensitive ion channel family protein n=1 Tax=Salirhabdus salicampi TaxID=476102 RepID=UPI0020C394CD|nr:mechanosensitive ion channel family protein [Salirhabdus salicampi]MCP8617915.1 mechanosensitive ion channel family protein [Salirhabdus salicampi]
MSSVFETSQEMINSFSENTLLQILIVGTITLIVVFAVRKVVEQFFRRTSLIEERVEQTLEAMINSIVRYAATFGFIIFVLVRLFHIPIGQILAGAGIVGIVVGLGAQSLIRDFLSGLFLLYEKQLHKGDFITINNTFHGTVEDIGLRFLKIREWSGKLLTISNGQINTIQNYNFEFMRVIEKVTTSFYEDPDKVMHALQIACHKMNEQLDSYLRIDEEGNKVEPFQIYGMTSLNDGYRGYQYTVTGVVNDDGYWMAARKVRFIIAETMFEHNIKMAEQHIDVRSASGIMPE